MILAIIYGISMVVLPFFMWWASTRIVEVRDNVAKHREYSRSDHKVILKEMDTLHRRLAQLELVSFSKHRKVGRPKKNKGE